MKRILPALALVLLILPFAAEATRAEESDEPNLMGTWRIEPFRWKLPAVQGCLYEQSIVIERRVGPGEYVGLSQQQTTCPGGAPVPSETRIRISISGDRVTITSGDPSWIPEHLRYISPRRMEGSDRHNHEIIYRRPRGEPTV